MKYFFFYLSELLLKINTKNSWILAEPTLLAGIILVGNNCANLGKPTFVELRSGLMPILVTLRSGLALFFQFVAKGVGSPRILPFPRRFDTIFWILIVET